MVDITVIIFPWNYQSITCIFDCVMSKNAQSAVSTLDKFSICSSELKDAVPIETERALPVSEGYMLLMYIIELAHFFK